MPALQEVSAVLVPRQHLLWFPLQVELDWEQRALLLAAEFPELSRAEVCNALEAQAGNLQAAAAILSLHASAVRI